MIEKYKNYEFYITIKEIDPPLPMSEGDCHFAAKPVFVRLPKNRSLKIKPGELGEIYGKTRRDTENKAIEYIKKWIDNQLK